MIGTPPSGRPKRCRRRAQANHPHPSPLAPRQRDDDDDDDDEPAAAPPRWLRIRPDFIPDPAHPRALFRPHGRRVPRRTPSARRALWHAARRSSRIPRRRGTALRWRDRRGL